jgi:hypothetical protein
MYVSLFWVLRTERLGVSMPPVTIKLDSTKADMRKGRRTGSPVSCLLSACYSLPSRPMRVPGCIVESITFFALHSSGVISWILPVLYAVTSCLAFSRPVEDVNRVLYRTQLVVYFLRKLLKSQSIRIARLKKVYALQKKQAKGRGLTTPRIANTISLVAQLSHLGSEMLAACCTRPQYVVRSYWELGRSRVPGKEEVMAAINGWRRLQPR